MCGNAQRYNPVFFQSLRKLAEMTGKLLQQTYNVFGAENQEIPQYRSLRLAFPTLSSPSGEKVTAYTATQSGIKTAFNSESQTGA